MFIYLLKNKYPLDMDNLLFFLNISYGFLSGLFGWLVFTEFDSFALALFIIIGSYTILCILKPPLYDDEKQKVINLFLESIRKKNNANT